VVAIASINNELCVLCEESALGKEIIFIIETECFRYQVRPEDEEKFSSHRTV
jgi:hypothetical protein